MINYLNKIYLILDKNLKIRFKVIFIIIFLSMLLESLSIGIFLPLISSLFGHDILNNYIDSMNFFENSFYFYLLVTVLIFTFKNLFLSFSHLFQEKFIKDLEVNTSLKIFKNYLKLSYTKLLLYNTAKLIRNVKDETSSFSEVAKQYTIFINEIVISVGVLILLFYFNFLSTLIVSSSLLTCASLIYLYNKNKIYSFGNKRIILDSKINKHIIQGLSAAKDLKILNSEIELISKLKNSLSENAKINIFIRLINILPRHIFETLLVIILSVILFIFFKNKYSISEIVINIGIFGVAATRLAPAAFRIFSSFQIIKFKTPTIDLIFNETVNQEENIKTDNALTNSRKKFKFGNQLNIKNLSYKYSDKFVLKNINLNIKKNDVIGIMGKTGSGKTTLLNIICGLLGPTKGDILIDKKKQNLNNLSWQNKISYVPQQIYLIEDTIEKNIAFGLKRKDINQKKLKDAIKISNLDSFIEYLPRGTKTIVGEKGFNISGGQRQRIGLARAIYLNKEILILDESTNSLDKDIELKVIKNIIKFSKNKTVIIVTHENKLLEFCKKNFLLQNGKLKIINK